MRAARQLSVPPSAGLLPPGERMQTGTSRAVQEPALEPQERLKSVAADLAALSDVKQRLAALVRLGRHLPPFPEDSRTRANQVMGCTSQVWLTAERDADDTITVAADSDSDISRGLAAVLINTFSGATLDDVLAVRLEDLDALALAPALAAPSRTNAFRNMLSTLQQRARALFGDLPRFPSLLITADALTPQGAFAEAQARFLRPDGGQVERLAAVLAEKQIGVVAHFYMDPEVQGVLSSAATHWPHIAISGALPHCRLRCFSPFQSVSVLSHTRGAAAWCGVDCGGVAAATAVCFMTSHASTVDKRADSLVMADKACGMARAGCKAVCVLGVDFMSENVRAILDDAGHSDVAVFRMASADIGCSLAEAAESDAYAAYLAEAGAQGNSMHVVYINTSLKTKARADAVVPTITCTSSNVVQTVLQGFAQVRLVASTNQRWSIGRCHTRSRAQHLAQAHP